jgi:hypothetical protein
LHGQNCGEKSRNFRARNIERKNIARKVIVFAAEENAPLASLQETMNQVHFRRV